MGGVVVAGGVLSTAQFPPSVVEDITGVPEAEMFDVAKRLADNRPGCVVWCMGGTQHTTGNNNTRAYCILELALGNIGKSGGGANILRGHDNVQGATDLGLGSDSLPGYYGLAEGAWQHWANVWDVDYEWLKGRFDDTEYADGKPMYSNGITVSRWVDGVLEEDENISQRTALKAMFYWGHAVNSLNDMHNSRSMLFIGSNPSEAHPVAMQHILIAKERNNCDIIVADPRFTRTTAKANKYVRIRPGSDVAYIWGLLWHIFENGWEDSEYINQRVYGMDDVRAEVAQFPPSVVEDITGVPEAEMFDVAKRLADNRPGCVVWCMGGTQHTTGNNNTRAYCILELALGNIGKSGGGANILRGHDNVQGATDLGLGSDSLPGYYGLAEGAWQHWANVWDVDYEWLKGRFDDTEYADGKPMYSNGITVSRWVDGVLEEDENISQRTALKAMFYWGHAVNSQTRGVEMQKAMQKLEMMVIVDPYPTVASVMHDRTDGVYLLPAATQFETTGSVTATNRSIQWRDQVIEPLFESKPDHEIMYLFARKLGFGNELVKNYEMNGDEPLIEDILREINRGMWHR